MELGDLKFLILLFKPYNKAIMLLFGRRAETMVMEVTFLVLVFGVFQVACTDCAIDPPIEKYLSETDLPGILLLEVSNDSTATWNLTAPSRTIESYFMLQQKDGNVTVTLNRTLDLEAGDVDGTELRNIQISLFCSQPNFPPVKYEWYVFVSPVNEFRPEFVGVPVDGYNVSVTVREDTRVKDTAFELKSHVTDKDFVTNSQEYEFILQNYTLEPELDGQKVFVVKNSLTGAVVVLTAPLDFEKMKPSMSYYVLNVTVGDTDGLTSQGLVRVNITDADDQPPEFYFPGCNSTCEPLYYTAAIAADFVGEITWLNPAQIAARDQDSENSTITYSLKGSMDYLQYLSIDGSTGAVSVIKPVNSTDAAWILVIVEAVENTELRHSTHIALLLTIVGRNSTAPTLPPIIVERSIGVADEFRLASIILGALLGVFFIFSIILIILYVCKSRARTHDSNYPSQETERYSPGVTRKQKAGDEHYDVTDTLQNRTVDRLVTTRKLPGTSDLDFPSSTVSKATTSQADSSGNRTRPANESNKYENTNKSPTSGAIATLAGAELLSVDPPKIDSTQGADTGGVANPAFDSRDSRE